MLGIFYPRRSPVPECTANALVTAMQAIGSHNTNYLLKLKFTTYIGPVFRGMQENFQVCMTLSRVLWKITGKCRHTDTSTRRGAACGLSTIRKNK